MKKLKVMALFLLVLAVGCGTGGDETGATGADEPLNVIATIFPQFDFVRQIAGDRVELSMLISPGAESHGFEPTPRDMVAINNADLLIYIGGHSDDWVERIIESLEREDLITVALLDLVDAVMADHEHHHDEHHHHGHEHHGHGHHHDHEHHHHEHGHHDHEHHHHDHGHHHEHHHHEPHYDEHVWTCPRNAILIVQGLTEVLAEADPANAEYFRANAAEFISLLQEIDAEFTQITADAVRTTIIFGDRFPFRYFADTYGLTAYAAFTGCSAETQASPATIAFLINKVNDENIPFVFHIEFSNLLIANVIAEATGARLLELHSAHNVSHADFNAGVTYIDLMRRNAISLREGLN
ncbi:MAG: metal ABC transporter substrate-binding protein [Defluviitaleaceae bacterium]|nr:metal ABC transporter substrate-binding protein [Defluviitaleaceae bacterium]